MDMKTIFVAFLFGAVGMGYVVYGRKQRNGIVLAAGIGLCAFPYFVSNLWLMVAIGIVLGVLPFMIRD